MEFPTRRTWSIPLKSFWPRKPTCPGQFQGVPIIDSKDRMVALVAPVVEFETDTDYNHRIGQALIEARHIRKLHNAEIRSSNASTGSDRRKLRSNPPRPVPVVKPAAVANTNLASNPRGGDFYDW